MDKLKRIEFIILLVLWIGSLTTYTIAILNNYELFTSDYLGLVGLTVVSIISFIKPDKALISVLLLLIPSMFNLLSFVYFFNIVMTFGFSFLVTPGIQLNSLILLVILIVRRRNKIAEIYRNTFGKTDKEKLHLKNRFKIRYQDLTDEEIGSRLQNDLVPEAKEALIEIKEERNNV